MSDLHDDFAELNLGVYIKKCNEANAQIVVLEAELARTKRAAKTLGGIVEADCRAALDATQAHSVIDKDGDGDWGYVWERMAELCAKGIQAETLGVDQ